MKAIALTTMILSGSFLAFTSTAPEGTNDEIIKIAEKYSVPSNCIRTNGLKPKTCPKNTEQAKDELEIWFNERGMIWTR